MKLIASRLFVVLLASVLSTQCRSAEPAQRERVLLAIFAHADDETSVSPVLAKYAAQGVRVYLVSATDGRLGVTAHAGIPAGEELAAVRANELRCAADKLGIQAPILFGLHDQFKMGEGLFVHIQQLNELRARVTRLFEELQPDAVVTWGPSGWTGHPDHRLVGAVVTEVFQSRRWRRPAQLYYPGVPTGRLPPVPPIPLASVDPKFLPVRVSVDEQDYAKARESWLCHQSQYTREQIEQLHQLRLALEAGVVHFEPVIATKGKSDSLL